MKTRISNKNGETLEIAKRLMYLIQVLAIGLFIPFSFVFGITYKRHNETAEKGIHTSKVSPAVVEKINSSNTVDFNGLPDQNS